MRRTTSTIKRVQDLLATRRDRRLERQAARITPDARAARAQAEGGQEGGIRAGQATTGTGGWPGGS